jgi:hypothetical protein
MEQLSIECEQIILFGGSWGFTLTLAYDRLEKVFGQPLSSENLRIVFLSFLIFIDSIGKISYNQSSTN